MAEPLLQVRDLRKLFPIRKGVFGATVANVHAVDAVSFDLDAGSGGRKALDPAFDLGFEMHEVPGQEGNLLRRLGDGGRR